ncbi:MAG TPA: tannase/feruloyl esterase family alpha/beta hydrolase [Terriglobales bacterium]|nr:tannase/feruloyl esterase family alpha/beta hydrolase [Terriglobales bacterium]
MWNQLGSKAALLAGVLFFGLTAWASPNRSAAIDCSQSAIQSVAPSNITIISATPQSDPVSYCDVLGYATTTNPGPNQVNFELGLPADWNGRFLFIGNGGFGGSLDYPSVFLDTLTVAPLLTEVGAGFTTAITDTGHQGAGDLPFLDGSWALDDPAKQDDWLFRAVHVVAVADEAITSAFYDAKPHSYFAGCSDGGREGLIEAEKYPADFDGIIAGDPDLGDAFIGFNWNEEHITSSQGSFIPPDKMALVGRAVLNSCDQADGVLDGLIQDPRKCRFDPDSLRCQNGNKSNCLTDQQIATLKSAYKGASTHDEQVYPGFTKSDPVGAPDIIVGEDGWPLWMTAFQAPNALGTSEPWIDPETPPWQFIFQDQFLKFFAFSDPNYNSLSFDINSSDLTKAQSVIHRAGAAATNPDLSAFRDHGGKLILYHGWSDPAVTPLETVEYYENMARRTGRGYHDTQEFARLFMAPGMRHCIGTGPGPNTFDPIALMISWVENNSAPDRIEATHYKDNDPTTGIVTRTMPLCPYPTTAKFLGGNVNDAKNWVCHGDH